MPEISIVIPAFNVGGFIEATLESVLAQTCQDFEVIVVDDHSTDDTKKIASSYAAKDNRIQIVDNSRRKGVAGARNTGISLASGKWTAFLDSDDLLHRESLQARLDAARTYPEASFISGDFIRFHDQTDVGGHRQTQVNEEWNKHYGEAVKADKVILIKNPVSLFLNSVLVHTDTVMIKTAILMKLGGFNESLPSVEDDQLWMRVSAFVDSLVFTPRSIAYYRQREGSLTRSNRAIHHHAPAAYKILVNDPLFLNHKIQLKKNIIMFVHNNTFHYRKSEQRLLALKSAAEGMMIDPKNGTSWKNLIACILLQ